MLTSVIFNHRARGAARLFSAARGWKGAAWGMVKDSAPTRRMDVIFHDVQAEEATQ